MKIKVEQVFACQLELNHDEAMALRNMLQSVSELHEDELDGAGITKVSWRIAKTMIPQLEKALLERNWRE